VVWIVIRRERFQSQKVSPQRQWLTVGAIVLIACASIMALRYQLNSIANPQSERFIAATRNFYGSLRVALDDPDNAKISRYTLSHGNTLHGSQFQNRRNEVTLYYVPGTGIALAIENHPNRNVAGRPFRMGVVGQGVGTLSYYARTGDYLRFYEINPSVISLGDKYFTYKADAISRGADVETWLGDARIVMERQLQAGHVQEFDLLVVDAFSGDAIPIHLLTRECFEIYWKHLKSDGILAIHISNAYLDLAPVVHTLAEVANKCAFLVVYPPSGERRDHGTLTSSSDWVLVTSNETFCSLDVVRGAIKPWSDERRLPLLWTDDFSSLFRVLR
jgi:hypothetical protein